MFVLTSLPLAQTVKPRQTRGCLPIFTGRSPWIKQRYLLYIITILIQLGNEVGQLQQKYSEAVNKSLQDLDARFLRKMQVILHHASLFSFLQSFYFGSAKKCCDNDSLTMEQVQTCLERCERPVNNAQTLVQGELRQLQASLFVKRHNDEEYNDFYNLSKPPDYYLIIISVLISESSRGLCSRVLTEVVR